MRATFLYEFDTVGWTVRVGWIGQGRYAAVEMVIDDFAGSGEAMLEALSKAHTLARQLKAMRDNGATQDEVTSMMAAIAADGGL